MPRENTKAKDDLESSNNLLSGVEGIAQGGPLACLKHGTWNFASMVSGGITELVGKVGEG